MTILNCNLDLCPLTGYVVKATKCCGDWTQGIETCQYYRRKSWSETGVVSCHHPKAHHASIAERAAVHRENMQLYYPSVR